MAAENMISTAVWVGKWAPLNQETKNRPYPDHNDTTRSPSSAPACKGQDNLSPGQPHLMADMQIIAGIFAS
jgi:hypothetical protein